MVNKTGTKVLLMMFFCAFFSCKNQSSVGLMPLALKENVTLKDDFAVLSKWLRSAAPNPRKSISKMDEQGSIKYSFDTSGKWFPLPGTGGFNGHIGASVFDRGVLYVGGSFTSAGGTSANLVARWNGREWAAVGSSLNGYEVTNLAVDPVGNLYAATERQEIDSQGWKIFSNYYRLDGEDWTYLDSLVGVTLAMVADKSGSIYVGGEFSRHVFNTDANGSRIRNVARIAGNKSYSLEGLTQGNEIRVRAMALDANGKLYVGGDFLAIDRQKGGDFIAQWDGKEWSAVGDNYLGSILSGSVHALALDTAGALYAAGDFKGTREGKVKSKNIARWNGSSWTAVGTGLPEIVTSVFLNRDGKLYAIEQDKKISAWQDNSWSTLSEEVDGGSAGAARISLAEDDGGKLFLLGQYSLKNDPKKKNFVSWWNGGSWESTEAISCDCKINSMIADSSGNLHVGGEFEQIGGVRAKNIARWNGSEWSALGSCISAEVIALALDPSDNLYVGGSFSRAGETEVYRVAAWNGNEWNGLNLPIDGYVKSLAFDTVGNLYIGGDFWGGMPEVDGEQVKVCGLNIVKWDGTNCYGLGSALDGTVTSILPDNKGNVYAGGDFNKAGDQDIGTIAKWDGAGWSRVGSGAPHRKTIAKLAFSAQGSLLALTGRFDNHVYVSSENQPWTKLFARKFSSLASDKDGTIYLGAGSDSAAQPERGFFQLEGSRLVRIGGEIGATQLVVGPGGQFFSSEGAFVHEFRK